MAVIKRTDLFESESAAKDYLAGDGLLNIEKVEQLNKKIEAQVAKATPPIKMMGRGKVKTMQITVIGKKTAFSKAMRTKFPRNNAEGVKLDVVADARNKTKFNVRLQKDGGFTPREQAAIAKELGALQEMKPSAVVVIGARAKTAKYTAAQAKKANNFTYLSRRAVKVAERTRQGQARAILNVYPKGILPAALEKQMLEAQKAAAMHAKKAETAKKKIAADRSKATEQRQSEYAQVAAQVQGMFEGMGIKPQNIIMGKSGFGNAQTLLVKLAGNKVISIGLSDTKAFNAAKKLSSESSDHDYEDFESESAQISSAQALRKFIVDMDRKYVGEFNMTLGDFDRNLKRVLAGTRDQFDWVTVLDCLTNRIDTSRFGTPPQYVLDGMDEIAAKFVEEYPTSKGIEYYWDGSKYKYRAKR